MSPSGKQSQAFYGYAFNKLCMWTDIFFDCMEGRDVSYEEYEKSRYNEENFREVLKKTGIVNLKKTWGGNSTEWKNLNNYLYPDKATDSATAEFIRKEIGIIKPDVVVCGSLEVFDFAVKIYNKAKKEEKEIMLSDGSSLKYFKHENTVFINFYHPSCPGKKNTDMYNYAKLRFGAIAELL